MNGWFESSGGHCDACEKSTPVGAPVRWIDSRVRVCAACSDLPGLRELR